MLLMSLSLPTISSILALVFGSILGQYGVSIITLIGLESVFFTSLFLGTLVSFGVNNSYLFLASWVNSDDFFIPWGFLYNNLTTTMYFVVTFIAFLVLIFSIEYLETDPHVSRFLGYLSLFTCFMLILVSADNLIQLFMGWEGVGLCSYLLINFWFVRIQANKSAIKALLVNKIGDLCLLFGILFLFLLIQSLEFPLIYLLTPFLVKTDAFISSFEVKALPLISIFFFLGAMGKSAQIGLHTWLPDAMEGPTPVSALIHAATMVTAGIFLLLRCSIILEYSGDSVLFIITFVGGITAFFAASLGLVQNDIKKIIAYSTCSQLGYMFLVCGLSNYALALFHVATHAFFKALLFLTSGAVIHSLGDEQDIRKQGALANLYPLYYVLFLLSSLSLSGFPFLSGYFSKDFILEVAFLSLFFKGILAGILGNFAAALSASYSIRLLFLVFFQSYKGVTSGVKHLHKVTFNFSLILSTLCLCAIFMGYLLSDMFVGQGSMLFIEFLSINTTIFDNEMLDLSSKLLPLVFTFSGCLLYIVATFYMNLNFKLYFLFYTLIKLLTLKLGFDYIYNVYLNTKVMFIGYRYSFVLVDKFFLEFFGPTGISKLINAFYLNTSLLATGLVLSSTSVLCIFSFFLLILNYYV